jgi:hypothetical protein
MGPYAGQDAPELHGDGLLDLGRCLRINRLHQAVQTVSTSAPPNIILSWAEGAVMALANAEKHAEGLGG